MGTRTYIELNHDIARPERWTEVELEALGQLIRSGYTEFPTILRRMGINIVYQRHSSDPCPCREQAEHWHAQMNSPDRFDLGSVLKLAKSR